MKEDALNTSEKEVLQKLNQLQEEITRLTNEYNTVAEENHFARITVKQGEGEYPEDYWVNPYNFGDRDVGVWACSF